MQFNTYSYLFCLLVAVLIFWRLPVRFRRMYVLGLSIAFYATWNVYLILFPIGICIIAFFCARSIRNDPRNSRRALITGIALILAILAVCKYRGFAIDALGPLMPWLRSHPLPTMFFLTLPLGISFYSFEAISYLLDTRQGRVNSLNFIDLCLFVMFWPHLIAGPIVRARELIPQLRFDRVFHSRFIYSGLDRLILGLVQKNVIANNIGPWVDDGFLPKIAVLNTTADNWFLAVAFGLQIYFDFSAYSNMAIGAARLIGITLPENFRFPYHASTPADFWSRWHMTLSRWIRDYAFFPLNAGFQNRKALLYLSLVAVMGVVGLWHGAGWGYILWGVMHGLYLVVYRMLDGAMGDNSRRLPLRLFWRVFTLVAIIAAWVPFRAVSLGQTATILSSMFWRFTPGISYSVNFYLITLLWCAYCVAEPYFRKWIQALDAMIDRVPSYIHVNAFVLRPFGYACLLLLFLAFDDRDSQFIYFQF